MRVKPHSLPTDNGLDTRLNYSNHVEVCARDVLVVEPLDSEHFLFWNTGDSSSTLVVEEAGMYQGTFASCGDTVLSEPLDVTIRPEIAIRAVNDTVGRGQRAMLRAIGNDINWYEFEDSEDALQKGSGLFIIPQLEKDTVLFAESRSFFDRPNFSLGPLITEENAKLPKPWVNAGIEFYALSDCRLKEFTVRAVDAGRRQFILLNLEGQVLERSGYMLDSHTTYTIDLGWDLQGGTQYVLFTDGAINFNEFNYPGPQLYQVDQDSFSFPYTDGEHISITGTSEGINEFYYFSNWVIEVPPELCTSDRVPVRGIVDSSVSESRAPAHSKLEVFPNPATGFFTVKTSGREEGQLQVRSADGRIVFEGAVNGGSQRINCQNWPAGMYIVRLEQGQTTQQESLFIAR